MFLRVMTPVLNAAPSARWRSLLARHMLKHTNPTLANLPLEHGHPATTANLTNLHKFLPIVSHYGDRVKERLFRRSKTVTSANGDSELLSQLGLLEISNWRLAQNSIFSNLWILNQIQKIATQGITLAGKRLITLELTLRSVEGSKLN